jgi:hypothetical protein
MTISRKALRTVAALLMIFLFISGCYFVSARLLALPFRKTNDLLHQQKAPLTLDFLIPAGTYIDEKMSIEEVMGLRLRNPNNKINTIIEKVSQAIPTKYRMLGTGMLYFFWVFVSFSFFRIVTWMRYATALAAAFLAGAFMYYFMPDLVAGKMDDAIFAGWALFFAMLLKWRRKRLKNQKSHALLETRAMGLDTR